MIEYKINHLFYLTLDTDGNFCSIPPSQHPLAPSELACEVGSAKEAKGAIVDRIIKCRVDMRAKSSSSVIRFPPGKWGEALVGPNFLLEELLISKDTLSCPHCRVYLKSGCLFVDAECSAGQS